MDPAEPQTAPKVAIVTGGSRGIGKAIVEQLAQAGFEVHFSYVSREDAAYALSEQLDTRGLTARAQRVDSRDIKAASAFVEQTVEARGHVDVLVHNAAITRDRLLPMMRDEDWCDVLETSLHGLFGATKAATRHMMRRRTGRIVAITSVSGLMGMIGQTNYSAAKAAIIGFTRSLSKELASWNIPVNAVAPGAIDTEMFAQQGQEQQKAMLARIPMRRLGEAAEIASVVRFLATEAPVYLTGQTLVVDGGLSN
jgi:3-oxoacyl-[acyl-carrier protein] reductase